MSDSSSLVVGVEQNINGGGGALLEPLVANFVWFALRFLTGRL